MVDLSCPSVIRSEGGWIRVAPTASAGQAAGLFTTPTSYTSYSARCHAPLRVLHAVPDCRIGNRLLVALPRSVPFCLLLVM